MNLSEAKIETARYWIRKGHFNPSHCDVRCCVNDLTADNPRIAARGYDQDKAHRDVLRLIRSYRLIAEGVQ